MLQAYENKGGSTANDDDEMAGSKGDGSDGAWRSIQLEAPVSRRRRTQWRWLGLVLVLVFFATSHHVVSQWWRRNQRGLSDLRNPGIGWNGLFPGDKMKTKSYPGLSDDVKAYFESPEHRMIGDLIDLPYAVGNISGSNFSFPVSDGNIILSYGQVVALAGDFYSNWAFQDCPAQISDDWSSDPRESMQQFSENVNSLYHNTGGYISCILETMVNQANQVADSPDPAQRYWDLSGVWGYDGKYGYCTNGGYLYIALCNWDHFGEDAVRSYIAGHTVALEAAVRANIANSEGLLKTAYFYEAFAQHFLTDLFSAGHLRAPRRDLHAMFGILSGNLFSYDPWPADKCSQAAHDEDSANGLWVTNRLGESWAVYGDKQITSPKSNSNLEHIIRAMQKGVEEVHKVFMTGKLIEKDNYKALDFIPNVETLSNGTNFPALFAMSNDGTHLRMRTHISNRNVSERRTYNISALDFDEWTDIYTEVEGSAPFRKMYPLTLSPFMPETNITQLRVDDHTGNFLVSKFGPLWSRNFSSEDHDAKKRSWNMLSQNVVKPGEKLQDITWRSAKSLDPHVYSLVGRNETNVVHVGMCDKCGKRDTPEMLWLDVVTNPDPDETCDVCYGKFSLFSDAWGMAKACRKNETGDRTRYEMWTLPKNGPPEMLTTDDFTDYKPHLFTLRNSTTDRDTFVFAGFDNATSTFKWTFTTFTDDYVTPLTITYEETNHTYPYQEILTGQLTPDGPTHIFRMSYGTRHGKPGVLQLDVLLYTPENPEHPITTISTTDYAIVWSAQYEKNYLLWFLYDVDGDGRNDLVAYVDHPNNDNLITLVFKQHSEYPGRFVDPRVTMITPQSVGKDFNGPWFASAAVRSEGGKILEVLDYYGVMGVRMLEPFGGNRGGGDGGGVGGKEDGKGLTYRVAGQVPAVAGQISEGLGWVNENGKEIAVGYFFDGV